MEVGNLSYYHNNYYIRKDMKKLYDIGGFKIKLFSCALQENLQSVLQE